MPRPGRVLALAWVHWARGELMAWGGTAAAGLAALDVAALGFEAPLGAGVPAAFMLAGVALRRGLAAGVAAARVAIGEVARVAIGEVALGGGTGPRPSGDEAVAIVARGRAIALIEGARGLRPTPRLPWAWAVEESREAETRARRRRRALGRRTRSMREYQARCVPPTNEAKSARMSR